jgi:EpsI family protein
MAQSDEGRMTKTSTLRFAVAALLMLATALLLQGRSRNEVDAPREALSSLPSQFGPWTATDIQLDQPTLDVLGPGEFLFRDYEKAGSGQPPVSLFIAYFPSQKAGDTIHSPNNCLPGAGWIATQKQRVQIARDDGPAFPANRYVVSRTGERQLVLFWWQAHDRVVTNEYWAKYYLVTDSIRMNRTDGGLVRFMTPMFRGESADAAQARVMALGSQIIPLLSKYIPR